MFNHDGFHLKPGERFGLDDRLLELLDEGGRAEVLLAWVRPEPQFRHPPSYPLIPHHLCLH